MARAIATISGVALAPGVSRNGRRYTRETIARMVTRASERITAGKRPITMYTSHDSVDVADIGGVLTGIWQESDGRARYTAEVPDTPTGHAVAALADASGGPQFLQGVSILGNWVGGSRHETGPDGTPCETGSDFELGRLDFTTSPGVDGASIDALTAATAAGGEGLAGYAVFESAPEALVTVTTEQTGTQPVAESTSNGTGAAPAVPEGVREILSVFLGAVGEADDATPAISKRNSGLAGSGRKWADPGYQADKKQRYDITTKQKALTAWKFINQKSKAAKYSGPQLKQVKARIRAALKGFGVSVSTESAPGWGFMEPVQVSEAVAEFYGDGNRSGSWSVSACNGPVNMSLSSYCMDPADLDVILRAAADAACQALAALDPDMDGDVDVPGVGDGSDTDGDAGHEAAPPAGTTESGQQEGQAGQASPDQEGESAVTETSNQQAAGAAESTPATITQADLDKAVREASEAAAASTVEAYEAARQARKAAKRAAAAPVAPAAAATETAGNGGTTEATSTSQEGSAAVSETQEQRDKRIIREALAAAGVTPAVTETEDERVERLVGEGLTRVLQEAVAGGAILPGRAGIMVREHAVTAEEMPADLAAMSDDGFQGLAGGALDKYVGDSTRVQAVHT